MSVNHEVGCLGLAEISGWLLLRALLSFDFLLFPLFSWWSQCGLSGRAGRSQLLWGMFSKEQPQ